MKKLSILVSALIIALTFASCEQKKSAKNVTLKTQADTVSYAIGASNGAQMKEFLPMREGLDMEKSDEFIQGVLDEFYGEEKSKEYQSGRTTGAQLKAFVSRPLDLPNDSTLNVNKDAFVDGIVAAFAGENQKMTSEEANEYVQNFIDNLTKEKYGDRIAEQQAFLERNKMKEGVNVTPSGLQYEIIKEGKGEVPGENRDVKVHYVGTLIDGTQFDSSVDRGTPFEFNTSRGVIQGWMEAGSIMPVGSKWIIYVPAELGYGSTDRGTIPPYSTLIFEIEMLEAK